jgi:hypothetical protein
MRKKGFRGKAGVASQWARRRRLAEKTNQNALARTPSARSIARLLRGMQRERHSLDSSHAGAKSSSRNGLRTSGAATRQASRSGCRASERPAARAGASKSAL